MAYKPFKKNANGTLTEIPLFADMASKDAKGNVIDETYARAEYDLIITNQSEFDAFCSSISSGTCTASAVLLVGNGGTLTYTKSSGTIKLPKTLFKFDGKNRPKIKFTNVSGVVGLISQTVDSNRTAEYRITGIDLVAEGSATWFYGFDHCYNISDCSFYNGNTIYGFYYCYNVKNCKCEVDRFAYCERMDNCIGYMYERCKYIKFCEGIGITGGNFSSCEYLAYCTCQQAQTKSYGSCKYLYCCKGTMARDDKTHSWVFGACDYLFGCQAENYSNVQNGWVYGFYNCTNLSLCTANSTTTYTTLGYYSCENLSNCSTTLKGNSITAYDRCINLSDCSGVVTGSGSDYAYDYSNGYEYCEKMSNCEITITDIRSYGYYYCKQVSNCRASTIGIADVERTDGYGFYSCSYLSNCKSGTDGNATSLLGGTNTRVDSETVGD